MANIQNGSNTWYIALIQTLSLQYRDKCRIILIFKVESRHMTSWQKLTLAFSLNSISQGIETEFGFFALKSQFQSDLLGSLMIIVCVTSNQKQLNWKFVSIKIYVIGINSILFYSHLLIFISSPQKREIIFAIANRIQ